MHTAPLYPWTLLTREGIPPMQVIRRPLRTGFGEPLPLGAAYPPPDPKNFGEIRRTRTYYQMRRIAPVKPDAAAKFEPKEEQLSADPVAASPDLSMLPPHETKPAIRPMLPGKKGR
jgi:hypothetical protein